MLILPSSHRNCVYHLFWSCLNTEQLWNNIDTFIKDNIQQEISITLYALILPLLKIMLSLLYILFIFFANCLPIKVSLPKTNHFLALLKEFKMYNTITSSVSKKASRTSLICTMLLIHFHAFFL